MLLVADLSIANGKQANCGFWRSTLQLAGPRMHADTCEVQMLY